MANSLKRGTRSLIRIAKRERPKAVKAVAQGYWDGQKSTRKVARKKVADNLRSNRRIFGPQEARTIVLRGYGYKR